MSKENLTDFGVGGAAVSLPLWVQHLEAWAQAVVIVGGAALVLVRLCLALRQAKKGAEEEG